MKQPLVLTYATDHSHPGLKRLIASLERYQWQYKVLGAGESWQGFGRKLTAVREHIADLSDNDGIIFVDAYDTIVCRGWCEHSDAFWGSVIFSCEKACWPDADKVSLYCNENILDTRKYPWKYVNAGGYAGDVGTLKRVLTSVENSMDDQRYLTDLYLGQGASDFYFLDDTCEFFQSIAFSSPWEEEFEVKETGEVYNKITESYPAFIHGNGRTDMSWVPQ